MSKITPSDSIGAIDCSEKEFLQELLELLQTSLSTLTTRNEGMSSSSYSLTQRKHWPSQRCQAEIPHSEHSDYHLYKEAQALKDFSLRYKLHKSFMDHQLCHYFHDVSTSLINDRLASPSWLNVAPTESLIPLVICLRILLRDHSVKQHFCQSNTGLECLAQLLERTTDTYLLQRDGSPAVVELINELLRIILKLQNMGAELRDRIVLTGVYKSLVALLTATDLTILHNTINALISLVQSATTRGLVAKLNSIEVLVNIIRDFDLVSQILAAELLRILLTEREGKEMFKIFDSVSLLLSLLHSDSIELVTTIIWCLVAVAADSEMSNDIRSLGGILLLLSMLHNQKFASSSTKYDTVLKPTKIISSSKVSLRHGAGGDCTNQSLKCACCACLTELVVNDTNGLETVQNNGIYLLSLLILPPVASSDQDGNHTAAAPSSDNLKMSSCLSLPDLQAQPSNKASVTLQASALRTLRFLFSMERNRRHFRRLFPPNIFETFIDIGHYKRDITPYITLISTINELDEQAIAEIRENIEICNQSRAPSRYIGEYAVVETLGSGAFGTVYKVQKKKSSGESYLAMKEINTVSPTWGKTVKERQHSVGNVISEIQIMREKMKHANVVRYHKCFSQADKLYIVMELIEGATLAEHFTSLKEKQEMFSEPRIWNIFLQIVLALRYLHKEKEIVHRDLTPNNIMLGERDRVTITDFGLAKQKRQDCSQMNSVVGTILYSCPEIVQNIPYGEKADIWAMGCILYQMCSLTPPFYSSNMLQLATKIVEATYEPLDTEKFSPKVLSTIDICLKANPEERADVLGVAAHLAELLLTHLDTGRKEIVHLNKKLEREKQKSQKQTQQQQQRRCNHCSFSRMTSAQESILNASIGSDISQSEQTSSVSEMSEKESHRISESRHSQHGATVSGIQRECDSAEDSEAEKDKSNVRSRVVPRPPERGRPNRARLYVTLENSSHFSDSGLEGADLTVESPSTSHHSRGGTTFLSQSATPPIPEFSDVHTPDEGAVFPRPILFLPPSSSCSSLPVRQVSSPLISKPPFSPLIRENATTMSDKTESLSLPLNTVMSSAAEEGESGSSSIIRRRNGSTMVRPSSLTSELSSCSAPASRLSPAGNGAAFGRLSRPNSASTLTSGTSSAMVRISPSRVREIEPLNDPILAVLEQLYRLVYISQLPPTLHHDPRRSVIDRFKRALFAQTSSAAVLKHELNKLLSGSRDVIDLNIAYNGTIETSTTSGKQTRLRRDDDTPISQSGGATDTSYEVETMTEGSGITYEQMATLIDAVLDESGIKRGFLQSSRATSPNK